MLKRFKNFKKVALALAIALAVPVGVFAAAKGSTIANGFLQDVFKTPPSSWSGAAWTAPTNVYIGLMSACPTGGNYTSAGTELSGGGYYRSNAIAQGAGWNYVAATTSTAASVNNVTTATFPTASSAWSAATCFGVYDGTGSASGGTGCTSSGYGPFINGVSGTALAWPCCTGNGTGTCTTGNLLYYGTVTGSPAVGSGVTASFAGGSPGALSISEQ